MAFRWFPYCLQCMGGSAYPMHARGVETATGMSISHRRLVECLLVFGGLPPALLLLPPFWWPVLLATCAGICIGLGTIRGGSVWRCWFRDLQPGERAQLRHVMLRWLACTAALALLVLLFAPTSLARLPREQSLAWLVLLVGYPLSSVLPQEVIYRYLFRLRYRALFRHHWKVVSAACFAWLHIPFANPVAPLLSLPAGLFFAQTYEASRSLRLVVLEHSLYGALVFSIGLDSFFIHPGGLPST